MDDTDVTARINELAAEEHDLFQREGRGEATDRDRERLAELQVQLDPDQSSVRDERTVEGYVD